MSLPTSMLLSISKDFFCLKNVTFKRGIRKGLLSTVIVILTFLLANRVVAEESAYVTNYQTPYNQKERAEKTQHIFNGLALHDYFQNEYFSALTQLAINEKKGLIDPTGSSELLKAGLELHFDMDDDAGKIFAKFLLEQQSQQKNQQLNGKNVDPEYKDYVYFTFAKGLYKKGAYNKSRIAFNNIGSNLDKQYNDEFYFLSAQLYLKEGNVNAAKTAKANIKPTSIYHRYIAFNHAMTLLEQRNNQEAIAALEYVVDLTPINVEGKEQPVAVEITDEFEAIIDRANLAMGYLHIEEGENYLAMEAFKRISIDSLDTESAMLGLGWAAANVEQYPTALAIWQQLAKREPATPFVREALIAVGFAHEEMREKQSAYASYQNAVLEYTKQQQILNTEISKLEGNEENNAYILSLLKEVPNTTTNPNANIASLKGPQVELLLPKAITTYGVVASNEFEKSINDVNNLSTVIATLTAWQRELDAMALRFYGQNIVVKNSAGEIDENLSKEREIAFRQAQLDELLTRFRQVDTKLNQHAFTYNGKLFKADPVLGKRQDLITAYNQYTQLAKALEQNPTVANYDELKQRLDRLGGLLLWQINDYYLSSQGRIAKQAAVNAAHQLDQSRLITLTPVFSLQEQVLEKLANAKEIQQTILTQLQMTLGNTLVEQRNDLLDYIEKAKLAIVRLNDEVFIHEINREKNINQMDSSGEAKQ